MGRLLSMTFGRPVMISMKWDVPLPSLIDDEYLRLEGEGVQPHDTPSRLGLLTHSSRLFLILEDILSTFYSSHPESNVTEMAADDFQADKILADVLSLNRRLDHFFDEVPAYLRCTATTPDHASPGSDKSVELQRQVLHCRFVPRAHLAMFIDADDVWQIFIHPDPATPATRSSIDEVPRPVPLRIPHRDHGRSPRETPLQPLRPVGDRAGSEDLPQPHELLPQLCMALDILYGLPNLAPVRVEC